MERSKDLEKLFLKIAQRKSGVARMNSSRKKLYQATSSESLNALYDLHELKWCIDKTLEERPNSKVELFTHQLTVNLIKDQLLELSKSRRDKNILVFGMPLEVDNEVPQNEIWIVADERRAYVWRIK